MKIIDLHCHYLPQPLIEAFRKTPFAQSTVWVWANPAISDIQAHLKMMDQVGVDVEVLAFAALFLDSCKAAGANTEDAMRLVNDSHAEIVKAHPDRFVGTIAIDPFAGKATLNEIERGVTKLGLKAVAMVTSYDGLYIDDQQFWPIYKLAQELRVPIMAHPGSITPYWKEMQRAETTVLRAEVSMLVDTTICIGRFVRYSIYDKFPQLNFIFCQLGGTIPFLFGRFELLKKQLARSPKGAADPEAVMPLKELRDYKGRIFADCHSMDRVAMQCAVDNLGADAVVVGGDYPLCLPAEGICWTIDEINSMRLTAPEREKVFGGNAARLLNL